MKTNAAPRLLVWLLLAVIGFAAEARAQPSRPPAPRPVGITAADGTTLMATYFAAGKPGPGVLLFHQSNRTRKSWDGLAAQLAAAGIHTLTIDSRRHGEAGDLDVAFQWLASQPGVARDTIGVGGAGWLGVINSVDTAQRHPAESRSLVLISGETPRPGLEFLHASPHLPELFVFSDADEYPPTAEAMELLYLTASSPSKKQPQLSRS